MDACDVARQYMAHVNAGEYSRLADLFDPGAVFQTSKGRTISGRETIRKFYTDFLPTIRPVVRAASYLAKGRICYMEIDARMHRNAEGVWEPHPDSPWVRSAIDKFTVGKKGKIKHMIVYLPRDAHWVDFPLEGNEPPKAVAEEKSR